LQQQARTMMKHYIIHVFCYLWALKVSLAQDTPAKEFFMLCSGGEVEKIEKELKQHPDWAKATTDDGESCLHLAAIPGSSELTKLLLDAGADPNARSTFEGGLRMHPLSWNVYGGHADSVKILLEKGASVNADFDYMMDNIKKPVTVLDIVLRMLKQDVQGEGSDEYLEPFRRTRDILLQYGAKTYDEYSRNEGDL